MGAKDYGMSISPDGKRLIISVPIETIYNFFEPLAKGGSMNMNKLTAREQQVFGLLIKGLTAKDIANTIHICQRTVKFHLGNIYLKLNMQRTGILQQYGNVDQPTPSVQ